MEKSASHHDYIINDSETKEYDEALDAGGKPSTWFPPGMTRRAPTHFLLRVLLCFCCLFLFVLLLLALALPSTLPSALALLLRLALARGFLALAYPLTQALVGQL